VNLKELTYAELIQVVAKRRVYAAAAETLQKRHEAGASLSYVGRHINTLINAEEALKSMLEHLK
jgi:hypothetical protein